MAIKKERLNYLFHYDERTGDLVRKNKSSSRANRSPVGAIVGSRAQHGYLVTTVDGEDIYNHRAIWIMHKGRMPTGFVIDHIDGNISNNRIENLRCVSQKDNMRNLRVTKRCKSGVVGVYYCKKDQIWVAQIKYGAKMRVLGRSKDIETAANLRREAELKYGFLTHTHAQLAA